MQRVKATSRELHNLSYRRGAAPARLPTCLSGRRRLPIVNSLLGRIYNDPSRPSANHVTNNQSEVAVKSIRPSVENSGKLKLLTDGRGKREIPEETHRPAASSGTIPTCENPEWTRQGLNPFRLGLSKVLSLPRTASNGAGLSGTEGDPDRGEEADPQAAVMQVGALSPGPLFAPPEGRCRTVAVSAVWSSAGMKGREKQDIPEKICRPTASSGTIPTCENPVTRPGIAPGSQWWEASRLTARTPRPLYR
ncbi:hypothetical protein PR048_003612 [Dryococelus australis]|uniref:Uncharacterized protein n=1 Tax=Dryococelus australis TaxID=614101 RepID=A0ABQ9IP57_9NEOP|nr:hypothetical protein PR048_003612 [Dryococelus australis]